MEIVDVKKCYACGSTHLEKAFPKESKRHSSLMRVNTLDLKEAAQEIQHTFEKPNWTICTKCGLIFSGHRPGTKDTAAWYLDLFKISEERGYDVTPLPQAFLDGKFASGKKLYEQLSSLGLIKDGMSVLHVRCATGAFLEIAQRQNNSKVAGTDFFPPVCNMPIAVSVLRWLNKCPVHSPKIRFQRAFMISLFLII
jgi:hypothetical protein